MNTISSLQKLFLLIVLLGQAAFINAQAPGNDLICNATSLSVSLGCVQGTNVAATITGSPAAPACWAPNNTSHDVWYSFVASDANMTVGTDATGLSLNNTQVAIYSSSTNNCLGTITLVACSEGGGTNVTTNTLTSLVVIPGNTYFVRVDGNNVLTGTFCINVFETYIPGSKPCEAILVRPNNSACNIDNGNLVTNSTNPATAYPVLGVDYSGCDNETNQVGTWTTFIANSASVNLNNQSGGVRDYSFFSGNCGSPTWISCASAIANNANTTFSSLTIGERYFILTTLSAGATTTNVRTNLCVTNNVACTPPANNTCANAQVVTADVLYNVTTNCATPDNPPALCSGTLQNNIWFRWTTPTGWTGQAFFQLFEQNCSGGDLSEGTQVSVYNSNVVCGGTASCVATSNTQTDNNISIVWTPVVGQTYLINYDGYAGEVCDMNFQITNTAAVVVISVNSPTICAGDTVTLTATSPATKYLWSTGDTTSSITVSPSTTTIYTVTATVGGSGSAVSTVTVNPKPASPIATSNSPVCEGSAINLTASNIANATYNWTGPNGFTSAQQNPSIPNATSAASGLYIVKATVLGCANEPDTVEVTVNPLPAAPTVGSNSPLCLGDTLKLTATTSPGATYAWTGPNGFTSAVQNPEIVGVTNAAGGTYTVSASIGNCTSPTSSTTVVINALPAAPTATSNSPVCEGTTLNLNAGNIAGATYSWTGPNGFTSSDQNPSITSVTAAASGTYSVLATSTNGCSSNTPGTVTVVVNPIPTAPTLGSNSPVCVGTALNLTASNIQGATYSWTGPNNFTSAQQNPTINNAQLNAAGTYSATATVLGCTSAAATISVVVNPIPVASASSNSPICAGATLELNATTVAGATYSWAGPNGFTSALQNPTITNASTTNAGTYTLTVTADGCVSTTPGSVTVSITQISSPTAGSNSPLCEGGDLNLTATNVAGAIYSWTGPNGFTSNNQNPTITGVTTAAAGVYSVIAAVGGCTSSTPSTTTVVVNARPVFTASSNSPLCSGSTLNLTASSFAGATYAWVGPNSFASTQQNPSIPNVTTNATGTYSVVATANGCSSSAPATTGVTISPLPSAPSASSNSPVCAGANINLTSTLVAGATYVWLGPNNFTSSDQNPVIPNAAAVNGGIYSVRVNLNGCISSAATTLVTINNVPASPVASSNSPLCQGDTLRLNATVVAGASYAWTGPNNFSSNVRTPVIINPGLNAAGTYTVTTSILGCISTPASTNVVINATPPSPVASSNSPVCVGDTLLLFATTVPGATYIWTDPIGFTSFEQNPVVPNISAVIAGVYSVVAIINGCASVPATTLVVIDTLPVPSFTSNAPACVGAPVNFTNTGTTGTGYTFLWNFGLDATPTTSTAENPVGIVFGSQGTKNITLTTLRNQCSASVTQQISITGTPLASFTSDAPVCFPPGIVNFTNTSTGNVTSYLWSFGSGATPATSTLENPTGVTYATAGTKFVSLTVSGGGCSNTTTQTVDVGVVNAEFTSSVPPGGDGGCLGNAENFYNVGSSGSGALHFWNFGAGATPATSTDENPVGIVYGTSGAKIVLHIVTVPLCGTTDTFTRIITINPSPIASFTVADSICGNTGVNFTNTGSTGVGYTFDWDFGIDGIPTASTVENPSGIKFTTSGLKNVTLTVTNEFFCVDKATEQVEIINTPVALFGSNGPQCTGIGVDFTNLGTSSGVTFAWNFGAGASPTTSTDENPTGVVYATSGVKTVTLTLTNTLTGCTATYTNNLLINLSPTVSFTNDAPKCANVGVNFTNTGSTGGGLTYTWNFGQGAIPAFSTVENPVGVTYATSGTKTVSLTISNQNCSQTNVQFILIEETPVAAFASTAPKCTGVGVDFTNTGTNSGVNFAWNFGAGATPATSTDANPTGVVYTSAGVKTVTLVVTNAITGCSASFTTNINIEATPDASFTSTAPQCSNTAIDFTNTGSTGNNLTYTWNLGQGALPATSTAENPTGVNYTSSGTKTVTFTVANGNCSNTVTQTIVINSTPVADFANTAPTCTGLGVDFTNTGTSTGVSFLWNFGAGATPATSTDANPASVVYASSGTKTVTLVVTDNASACAVTSVKTLNINLSPTASFTSTAPQCANTAIDFTNTGSTGSNFSYTWNLGQGATPSTSTAENPTGIAYSSAGSKTVTLTIASGNCSSTVTQTIVINSTPVADFTNTAPKCTGLGVDFTNTGTANGASYAWNFGSGATPATSTDANPAGVTYSSSGIKSVTLVVTDSASGCSVSTIKTLNINQSPAVSFASNAPQCANTAINFTNTGSTGSNLAFTWTFGQGANPSGSNTENPTGVTYASSGTKTVTLTVADGNCSSSASQTITINSTPVADFTSTAPKCTGLEVDFTNTGSATGVTWQWDFGAGATPATATTQSPAGIVYSTSGTKTVTFIITDSLSGCFVSSVKTLNINQTPLASFASTAPQCTNTPVNFTNTGSSGSNYTYFWNLGQGALPSTSSAENPVAINYSTAGTKTVTLTVADANCSNTITQTLIINSTPTVDFTSTAPKCTGLGVDFTSTGTSLGVTWQWDFGAGATPSNSTDANPVGVVYATSGTKVVTLTVTDDTTNCSVTSTKTLNINQTPLASFTSNAPQCTNAAVNFTNTGSTGSNFTYTWNLGQGANPPTSTAENPSSVIYGASGTKTITFTVADANCSNTVTQTLDISVTPLADFTSTAPVCTGLGVDFTSSGTSAGVNWLWDLGAGATPATSNLQNPVGVVYSTSGIKTATLVVTDNTSGCATSVVRTLLIRQTPTATFTSTAPQCVNSGVTFTNTGTVGENWTYSWSFGEGAVPATSTAENPSGIQFGTPGVKTVTFTIADQNCSQTITQTVNVNALPVADAGRDTTICANRTVRIGAATVAGYTYAWQPQNTLDNTTVADPIAKPISPTTVYTVTVTETTTGCVNTDQVTITMLGSALVNAAPDVAICQGDSVQIGTGLIEGQFYSWTPTTGLSDSTLPNPVASPRTTTVYTLRVTNLNGCDAISDNVRVTVNQLPNVDAGNDDTITVGSTVQLTGTGALQYYWSPDSTLDDGNIFNPVAGPRTTTTYSLRAIDVFGCENTDTVRVTVISFEAPYWLPSAFTPNANGRNDVFYVRGGGFKTFEFAIYNRYGELLFITTDINVGWDGKINFTGQEAPSDTYVYRLIGLLESGEPVNVKGLVNLIR